MHFESKLTGKSNIPSMQRGYLRMMVQANDYLEVSSIFYGCVRALPEDKTGRIVAP
jgi:hypothetical protein